MGAYQKDLGRVIDVHIKGSEAVVDGWSQPLIFLTVGCLMGVGALVLIVRRLTRAPT